MATQASTPPSRRPSAGVVAQVLALSGQVPRTVEANPPAAPATQPAMAFQRGEMRADGRRGPEDRATAPPPEAAPQSPTDGVVPASGQQVRVLETSTPDRGEVAFALQIRTVPTPEEAVQHASPGGPTAAGGAAGTALPPPQTGVPATDGALATQKHAAPAAEPDRTPAPAAREHRPEAAPAERITPSAGTAAAKAIPPAAPDAQVRATAADRPDTPAAPAAKPVRPQDAMDRGAAPEAARAPVVRDMKLEVTGGQQRVEVRLSERAGEVKMTVRTADEPLANTLRENLPALNARLAESGLRSETWHPAASSPNELRHAAEAAARGASQDGNAQPRQQDRDPQGAAGQRRPKSPPQTATQKEKGKDFAWLMSSLR